MAQTTGTSRIKSQYALTSVVDAQGIVYGESQPLSSDSVPPPACEGRVLAADVIAPESHPPFAASIKDGYAVVSSDGPGTYPIAFEARAGAAGVPTLLPGQVAYITTGAPIPPGADAVIQVEDVAHLEGEKKVNILKQAPPGQDIRKEGSDIQQGDVLLTKGQRVRAAECGILASMGVINVPVHRRPRVAVISTGNEIVKWSTETLEAGKIRDSNGVMLCALAKEAGTEPIDLGPAGDTLEEVQKIFTEAKDARADIILMSGGVSMGDADLVKPLLEEQGTVHFGRVLMKPGKPLTFATVENSNTSTGRSFVFGLPGNPVSCIVCFHLFVRVCIRRLQGFPESSVHLPRVQATVEHDITLDCQRPEYMRVLLRWENNSGGGSYLASSTGGQRSSRLLSMRSAVALLELPQGKPGADVITAGTPGLPALLISDMQDLPNHT